MEWVASNGGPLIVLPAELAPYWRGTEPPAGVLVPPGWRWGDPDGPVCDYDRACAVEGYVGMTGVGPGAALVLGDEPMRTTFVPREDGGLFVRWGYAPGEEHVHRAVRTMPPTIWTPLTFRFPSGRGGVLLIDSAYAGDHLPPRNDWMDPQWLRLRLPEGVYRIAFADHRPDEETWLILVRLTQGSSS